MVLLALCSYSEASYAEGYLLDEPLRIAEWLLPADSVRSLPSDKYRKPGSRPGQPAKDPKRTRYGKSRLGLKISFGVGGGLAVPSGEGIALNGAIGFYFDHVAFQVAFLGVTEGLPGEEGIEITKSGVGGYFIELEIYERSRRKRSMDTYWIVGFGAGWQAKDGVMALGPAVQGGVGVNLIGGEEKFGGGGGGISVISFDGIEPYFAIHARLPVIAAVTPMGVTLAVAATLVIEIAYQ